MSQKITLAAADGHTFTARRSDPVQPPRGGIVVLHAVYGLSNHMGDVCDQFASRGYAAIVPALYDRIGKDIVHPFTAQGAAAGVKTYSSLTRAQILADVDACAAALRPCGRVAISGFCTGGTWAWIASAELAFDAQVNFYGSHVPAHLALAPRCPTIMHYGDSDQFVSMEAMDRIRAAHPEVLIQVYPGGKHAFFNPQQQSYDSAHATLALEQSIAFLDRQLRP
jgi:carboxymethylenebutenolidase